MTLEGYKPPASSSSLLGSAFQRVFERSASELASESVSGVPTQEVLHRQGQLRAFPHLNRAALKQACQASDATDIDWLEAVLRIRNVLNPYLFGFIQQFRTSERLIFQGRQLMKTETGTSLAVRSLVQQATAVADTVRARQLKPQQIQDELSPLINAYRVAVKVAEERESAEQLFLETIQSLNERVIVDGDLCQKIPQQVVVLLDLLNCCSARVNAACEEAFHAQTWECYHVMSCMTKEREAIVAALSTFTSLYDALATQAGIPKFQDTNGLCPFPISPISPSKEPPYRQKVNWLELANQLNEPTRVLHAGLQPKLNRIDRELDELATTRAEIDENIHRLTQLKQAIHYRIQLAHEAVPMDDAKHVSITDLHGSYHTSMAASIAATRTYMNTLASIQVCFPSDPASVERAMSVLDTMGFRIHIEGNGGGCRRILACYERFMILDQGKFHEWGTENALAKEIRRDFDRLGWILEGWSDPWGVGIPFFQLWRIKNSYIQRDAKDLPADLLDD